MSKLFVDLYEESGDLTNLVYNQDTAESSVDILKSAVWEQYQASSHYRLNDAELYAARPPIKLGAHRAQIRLGGERYLLYWVQ